MDPHLETQTDGPTRRGRQGPAGTRLILAPTWRTKSTDPDSIPAPEGVVTLPGRSTSASHHPRVVRDDEEGSEDEEEEF